jgi:hypothetical protein
MEPSMIYILDEKRPYAELSDQFDKTQPLSKEQVVDLIISKINGKDDFYFKLFIEKYEKESFSYHSSVEKYEIYLMDFTELEEGSCKKGTWDNPSALKSDLLKTEFSYYYEYGKTILYNRQIEVWCHNATCWLILSRQRAYLTKALNSMKILEERANKSSYEAPDYTDNKTFQGLEKDSNEKAVKLKAEKKIPEKWYALLHIILISLNKKDAIDDLSDMKGIMALGKLQYKLNGTGQGFYREIKNIKSSTPAIYIANLSKKDRKKMKSLLVEISGNDADVILHMKKLPK